ncbi:MAG: TraL conjugative transposon family protein [Dysgonamonadaceae bacterium]|jgi:hypothetical protein|nr:TraL conjugative transposon family protein [Dysgonamonadaceae bacterium]
MKELRSKVVEFVSGAWGEIEYGLKCLCGRPSPMKRFIAVLTVGGVLAVANIYFVANSIYNMGKRDAEKEFLKMEHIKRLDWQPANSDSINNQLNKKYEYE